jgi:pyruvate dehydrogenase E1 component alpha subunit
MARHAATQTPTSSPEESPWLHSSAPAQAADVDLAIAREVIRVRLSMLRINDLMKQGAFRVPIHLALGHEAIAVAVASAMGPGDRLLLTHRNIHYHLARSPDLARHIAEYALSEHGLCGGRHGAMNMTHPARGLVYTSSILANCLVVAVGIAKARSLTDPDAATFAVTGDGAMEEGAFYEALLMSRSLRLPVVFLIENNRWSMYTRIEERRCPIDLRNLAASFAVPFHALRGNDAALCRERLASARREAVAQRAPCIVEVSLATLGDRHVDDPGRPRRYVNYHHGAVRTLDGDGDAVIEASDRDPVYVLSHGIPDHAWDRLVGEVRRQIGEAPA